MDTNAKTVDYSLQYYYNRNGEKLRKQASAISTEKEARAFLQAFAGATLEYNYHWQKK